MISQLFSALAVIALLSFLIVRGRRRRIWSVLLLFAGIFFMHELFDAFNSQESGMFAYRWLPQKVLDAHFLLSSSLSMEKMLFPLLGVLLGLVYLNIVYKNETRSLNINALLLLGFCAFIILASAQDFIQLMVGSCAVSLLGYYQINDMAAKNKFVFYNFWAEIAVFTALAIVYGKMGGINLSNLKSYAQSGWHKDLVAVLLLAAVFCKAGMALFQNQMLDIQKLRFNRVICLSLFSTPLAALFLWAKLSPLLSASIYTRPLTEIILYTSLLWGTGGCLLADNIKAKALYFNMMFWTFALFEVIADSATLSSGIVYLLPQVLLINVIMLMVTVSASDEMYVSLMGGFRCCIKFTMLLSLSAVFLFISSLAVVSGTFARIYLYAVLLTLAFWHNGIYLGKVRSDEKVAALLRNAGFLYWLPVLLAIAGGLWLFPVQGKLPYVYGLIFLILAVAVPRRFNEIWSDNEFIQEGDLLQSVYRFLILSPLRLLGRILWIAVDFVVIERSIIGSISHASSLLVGGLHKIQSAVWLNCLIMFLIGVILLAVNWGYYSYE